MGDELLLLWAGGIIGFWVGCLVTTLLRTRHYVILPPRRSQRERE